MSLSFARGSKPGWLAAASVCLVLCQCVFMYDPDDVSDDGEGGSGGTGGVWVDSGSGAVGGGGRIGTGGSGAFDGGTSSGGTGGTGGSGAVGGRGGGSGGVDGGVGGSAGSGPKLDAGARDTAGSSGGAGGSSACTNPQFPQSCPAANGLAAGCWSANTACSTIASCNGSLLACTSADQRVECETRTCVVFRCSNPMFPVFCAARGGVAADCWNMGTDCTTVVKCGMEAGACKAGFTFQCETKTCVARGDAGAGQ